MNGMKENWVTPETRYERFTPNEYVASCTVSSSESANGEYVYGWVMRCQRHYCENDEKYYGHLSCSESAAYKKYGESGTVTGVFFQARDQSASSQFSLTNVVASSATWLDENNNNTVDVGEYWIIDDHAIKIGEDEDTGGIAYPYVMKFDVNHS